jgi:hypothetical protein
MRICLIADSHGEVVSWHCIRVGLLTFFASVASRVVHDLLLALLACKIEERLRVGLLTVEDHVDHASDHVKACLAFAEHGIIRARELLHLCDCHDVVTRLASAITSGHCTTLSQWTDLFEMVLQASGREPLAQLLHSRMLDVELDISSVI